ncbi:hypothetical protein AV944_11130 [Sphingomonas sp. LK11]|uniref:hypothetical protein n=1 Tax=Sphingomonas sp. LK11 TaxID=1390395 RepID=UPI000972CCD8|nr:hypothetical protein [Sphingomonas sp. LK11]APX66291.1 hypothetical protein AV944_11130 [Sphingomonas sp. LK11]
MTYITFIDGAPLRCPDLEAYWQNPRPFEAEVTERRASIHSHIDAGMAALNAKQAARWDREGEL